MKRIVISALAALFVAAGLPGQKAPAPKSQAELAAIQEMFKATDPDSRIKAADNLITKFADTDFKATALMFMADSYQQKGDYEKMVVYGERALEADPKSFGVMTMLANGIASKTRENDLDKEEKLARAEKYARDALEVLKDASKPTPAMPDDQWAAAKKEYTAQAHQGLGIAAVVRKKYDVAINEFKLALDTAPTPDPATMVRLGAVYNQAGKPDEAIAILDKAMAIPDANPTVKQFAQAEKVRATKAKESGVKPSTNSTAPPQVEIKKQ